MIHRFSLSVGFILLAFILISCSSTPPQAEVEATNVPPTETPSPTLVPTLDLPIEELNEQLFEAIRDDDVEQIALLIASGADTEARDATTDATALIISSYRGNVAVTEALIAAGADVNSADRAGITPLMGAAESGHAALIPILVEAGAETETLSTSRNGQNALHLAALSGYVEVVEALLNAGADVDGLENTHSTALMYAAYWGHAEVVELLLEHGADVTILDNGEHTASYWADRRGFPEIAQIIDAAE